MKYENFEKAVKIAREIRTLEEIIKLSNYGPISISIIQRNSKPVGSDERIAETNNINSPTDINNSYEVHKRIQISEKYLSDILKSYRNEIKALKEDLELL